METLGFGPNPRWRLSQDQVLQRLGTGRSADKTCWWLIADLRGIPGVLRFDIIPGMRDVLVLFLHVVVTVFQLARPGGLRSVIAESVLARHQLLILNRDRKRAPHQRVSDRIIAGLCTLLLRRARVLRSSIVLRPSTLLDFHRMLMKRKYRMLFSPKRSRRRTLPCHLSNNEQTSANASEINAAPAMGVNNRFFPDRDLKV